MKPETTFGLIAVVIAYAAETSFANIINVPGDQPTIQAGINAAVNGDEVVLADGTYTGAGNVNCNFNGKLITLRSASDNPEACIIDGQHVALTRFITMNSGETSAAALRGITFTRGFMTLNQHGGALFLDNAGPTIINCRFVDNGATSNGGAIYMEGDCSPTFLDCEFIDNNAGFGGAMYWTFGGNAPMFTNCLFEGNHAGSGGGAVVAIGASTAVFTNCLFHENSATRGGAMLISPSTTSPSVTLRNCSFVANLSTLANDTAHSGAIDFRVGQLTAVQCLFNGNTTHGYGGAVKIGAGQGAANASFTSCTFTHNQANSTSPDAGGAGGAIRVEDDGVLNMSNCIAWNDLPNEISNSASAPGVLNISYSNIEDGQPGPGVIDLSPMFVDPNGVDDIAGTLDDDLTLRTVSGAIDAGNNAAVPIDLLTDLAGQPRFVDDPNTPDIGSGDAPIVDMGCFEFQPSIVKPECPADIAPDGGDGIVNVNDLFKLLSLWGTCPQ